MRATCGHEVKQGIMATLDLLNEYSYGSYCDKCIKLIHKHDKSVADGELKNILDEIQSLQSQLKKAEEVIGFYADKGNWGYNHNPKIHRHLAWCIENHDCGYCQSNDKFVGGKLAREYFKNKESK